MYPKKGQRFSGPFLMLLNFHPEWGTNFKQVACTPLFLLLGLGGRRGRLGHVHGPPAERERLAGRGAGVPHEGASPHRVALLGALETTAVQSDTVHRSLGIREMFSLKLLLQYTPCLG